MLISEMIRELQRVHEHHGDLDVLDDRWKPIVGVFKDDGGMFVKTIGDPPACVVSVKRRDY